MRARGCARWAAAALALVLLAPACGGSDDEGSARTTTASSATSGPVTSGPTTVAPGEPVGSAGCGTPPDPGPSAAGDVVQTLSSEGRERSYRLSVPASYDPDQPAPLILNFHGLGSNAAEQSVYSGLPKAGADRGAIVVTPDSIGGRWSVTPDSYDVRLVEDLLDEIEGRYCTDTRRVFAAGLSLGAVMTAVAACGLPGRFGAIGLVTLEIKPQRCDPIPVMVFHGTSDPVVPYDPPGDRKGTTEHVAEWVELDGCDPEPAVEDLAPDVRHATYAGCLDGTEVQLYTVDAGGHSWPGADIPVPWGRTTQTVDATQRILDFFEAHPLTTPG